MRPARAEDPARMWRYVRIPTTAGTQTAARGSLSRACQQPRVMTNSSSPTDSTWNSMKLIKSLRVRPRAM